MNDHDDQHDDLRIDGEPQRDDGPVKSHLLSQAEIYDALRRIGELEDEKRIIQEDINHLTDQLKDSFPNLDKGSLLHKMLTAALPAAAKAARKPAARKQTKKKR